jgi:hypothetical protein
VFVTDFFGCCFKGPGREEGSVELLAGSPHYDQESEKEHRLAFSFYGSKDRISLQHALNSPLVERHNRQPTLRVWTSRVLLSFFYTFSPTMQPHQRQTYISKHSSPAITSPKAFLVYTTQICVFSCAFPPSARWCSNYSHCTHCRLIKTC